MGRSGDVGGKSFGDRLRHGELFHFLVNVGLKRASWDRAVEDVQDAQRHPDSAGELPAF